jgi:diadenosine tetraphosphate (Ap4A) HIT family hydrolase
MKVKTLSAEVTKDPDNRYLFRQQAKGAYWIVSLHMVPAVSPGYTLVITRRQVASFFELTPEEVQACMGLISEVEKQSTRNFSLLVTIWMFTWDQQLAEYNYVSFKGEG